MAWSYSGDPSGSEIDRCRFLVGDTDAIRPLFQDEELQYIIDTANGVENVLLYSLFNSAAVRFARDVKRQLGPQSEDPTERLAFFTGKAKEYKAKLAYSGLSVPVYQTEAAFYIGMMDNV